MRFFIVDADLRLVLPPPAALLSALLVFVFSEGVLAFVFSEGVLAFVFSKGALAFSEGVLEYAVAGSGSATAVADLVALIFLRTLGDVV